MEKRFNIISGKENSDDSFNNADFSRDIIGSNHHNCSSRVKSKKKEWDVKVIITLVLEPEQENNHNSSPGEI